MAESTVERGRPIVGREAELASLDGFLTVGASGAFALTGDPGVGKTTLWEAGVAAARQRGLRVLSALGSGAETRLSSAVLIDLLDGVGREELAGLPPPQLQALEVALFRAEPAGAPPESHVIGLGLLNTMRSLAAQEPLLVAIDDVQWLDRTSSDALVFAARRLDAEPVAFLLARRPGAPPPLERALEARSLERLDLGVLTFGATRRVLSERLGLSLPRNVLRRVFETTLGNPLFTIEVGRTLRARGTPGIGEDVPLPDTVEELLGTRVASLPDPVQRLVLAVALSADLRVGQAGEISAPPALDEAVDSGVLVVDGDRLRPAHPLFATAAKNHAGIAETRELHLALAPLTGDEESRALHRALAADEPDEELAATVAAAAADAAARGARQDAVILGEHALRLTPREDPDRTERLLVLGAYLALAGEKHRLTDLLSPELERLPSGGPRARAFHLLTDGAVSDNDEIRRYLSDALAESGADDALRAVVLAEIAVNDAVIRVERIREAEASALEALAAAPLAGPGVERHALQALGWARALLGRPIDDVCERFRAVSGAAPELAGSPERVAGQRLTWRGEVRQARAVLSPLLALADERGESYSYVLQRLHMCQLELRIGDCEAAARLLDEWAQSSERVMWSMYERCRALLEATRGLPEDADRWAAETLAGARAAGNQWDRLEALRARGTAALLRHEPAQAAEDLRAVWEHKEREGVEEPGVFPIAPELVEALIQLGEVDEATAVTARLREVAARQKHPWAVATGVRCAALAELSGGYDDDEAAALEHAAAEFGALDLRFDRARTLLGLGRLQRRSRKWAAARDSLDRAAATFDELGAPGWAEEARSERARVGGRKAKAPGELTPTERRVVELAADGLANKEIAQGLFITVRTVEFHLKHAYEKLGIRSRTQLARRLSQGK